MYTKTTNAIVPRGFAVTEQTKTYFCHLLKMLFFVFVEIIVDCGSSHMHWQIVKFTKIWPYYSDKNLYRWPNDILKRNKKCKSLLLFFTFQTRSRIQTHTHTYIPVRQPTNVFTFLEISRIVCVYGHLINCSKLTIIFNTNTLVCLYVRFVFFFFHFVVNLQIQMLINTFYRQSHEVIFDAMILFVFVSVVVVGVVVAAAAAAAVASKC